MTAGAGTRPGGRVASFSGPKLREARLSAGLSIVQLAALTRGRVSKSQISNAERGGGVSAATAGALAAALRCSVADLKLAPGEQAPAPVGDGRHARAVRASAARALAEEGRQIARETVNR